MKTFLVTLSFLLVPFMAGAQTDPTVTEPTFKDTVYKAEVVTIHAEGEQDVVGTGLRESYQDISVRIIEGDRTGEMVRLENDSGSLFSEGDQFYLHRLPATGDSPELWSVGEPDRGGMLLFLLGLFIAVTLLVAGMAGLRSLVALAASFALIIFALVPALSLGFPPAVTSIGFGVLILSVSMFVTHGVNRPTFVALLGSFAALTFAALLAQLAVTWGNLSGFVSDEAVFLNFQTAGAIDLTGLLLGGILIGIIGVLNDVSVSQVHTVVELHDANPTLSKTQVWRKSMKVGREHMGAVVNTLPLAYAGVSLPLLLLFSQSDAPFAFIVNREIFSAEIIRALAGSIGLLLSGAIATGLAVAVLVHKTPRDRMTRNK